MPRNNDLNPKLFIVICFVFLFAIIFSQNYIIGTFLITFIAFVLSFIYYPQITLFGFGCFLIFQSNLMQLVQINVIHNLDEFFILIFFILTLCRKIINKQKFRMSPIDIPLLLVITFGLLSSVINHVVSFQATFGGLFLFLKGMLLFYIFANTDFKENAVDFFLKGFFLIGIFITFMGILGFLFPSILGPVFGVNPVHNKFGLIAMQSIFGHPGAFSAFMAILTCFSVASYLIREDRRFFFLSTIFIICSILTFRRTSIFGITLAVFLAIFLNPPSKIKATAKRNMILLIVFLVIVFSVFIFVMFQDLVQNYLILKTMPRNALSIAGGKIAIDFFPLGSGFGSFGSGINRYEYSDLFYRYRLNGIWGLSSRESYFINDVFWPHLIAEVGILGLIFYLFVIKGFFKICRDALARFKRPILKIFALGAYMLLIESLVESTKATFYEMSLWTYFYFGAIGILWSILNTKKKGQNCMCKEY